jgi:Tol biopolymer transport system component
LTTGELHKLIDDALGGAALSPDQSRIVFRRTSVPEIWTIKVNGEDPRRLLTVPPDSLHDSPLAWFPDGRRIAFATVSRTSNEFSIQSYDIGTGQTSVILSDPKGGVFCLTPEGRIIYSRLEDPPNEKSADLWAAEIDLRTAQLRGAPRRLTNWPGSLFSSLGSTADGSRLFFVRLHYQNSVYVGQLVENANRLVNPRRFSFEQWSNWPTGWNRESQAVFFNSDRAGRQEILQQPIAGRDPAAVAGGPDEKRDGRLSPDGRWLLYLAWPRHHTPGNGKLMRVGARGEPVQTVFPVSGYSTRMRTDPLVSISAEGHPAFRCPSVPSAPCVLSEEIQDEAIFTAFDPVQGRKAEVLRLASSSFSSWDLSPDGRWIALSKNEENSGRIRLVSLAGDSPRNVEAGGWTHLLSVAWASNGKALFVTAFASKGAPLLRVALDGNTRMLYRGLKYVEHPVASPDGRYLAFGEMTEDGNAWLLDARELPSSLPWLNPSATAHGTTRSWLLSSRASQFLRKSPIPRPSPRR